MPFTNPGAQLKVLIDERQLQQRVKDLGEQISLDYQGKHLHLICILKGACVFLADLIRHLPLDISIDFMAVSSYGDAMTTSGTIHIEKDLAIPIDGKDVIIVEDIVDTGLTLLHVYNILSARGAGSIRVATLLEKPGVSKYDRPLDYVGFKIPNRFVFGFGLDYGQRFRNLPEIRVLDEE